MCQDLTSAACLRQAPVITLVLGLPAYEDNLPSPIRRSLERHLRTALRWLRTRGSRPWRHAGWLRIRRTAGEVWGACGNPESSFRFSAAWVYQSRNPADWSDSPAGDQSARDFPSRLPRSELFRRRLSSVRWFRLWRPCSICCGRPDACACARTAGGSSRKAAAGSAGVQGRCSGRNWNGTGAGFIRNRAPGWHCAERGSGVGARGQGALPHA